MISTWQYLSLYSHSQDPQPTVRGSQERPGLWRPAASDWCKQGSKQGFVQAEVTFTDRAIGRTDRQTDRRTHGTRRVEQAPSSAYLRTGEGGWLSNDELTHDAPRERPTSPSGNLLCDMLPVVGRLSNPMPNGEGIWRALRRRRRLHSSVTLGRVTWQGKEGGGGRAARSNLPPFLRSTSKRAVESRDAGVSPRGRWRRNKGARP